MLVNMPEKTVLVVDDDENIMRALSIRLKAAGYKVSGAMDGTQAVMVAHKVEPDIIVLDIRMPAGSGFTVMERLRQSIDTATIPIIVLTASDETETRRQAEEMGAFRYFNKPYDIDKLLVAIKEALGGGGLET